MKFVYVLLFLTILTIAHATDVLRTEKNAKRRLKSKSNTKDNGDGSYQTGLRCGGGIWVAKNKDALKNEGTGTFYPLKLENPQTDAEKNGLCFAMTGQPGENLRKIMVRDGSTNNWCLPFRLISDNFTYTNPRGDFKYIEGRFTSDEDRNTTYRCQIKLPYKYFGWYINDQDSLKICDNLNAFRVKKQNTIAQIKSETSKAVSKYLTNKGLYDAATKSGTALEDAKKKAQSDLLLVEADIATTTQELKDKDNEISEWRNKLSALEEKRNQCLTKCSDIGNNKAIIEDNLKNIIANANDVEKTKKDFKDKADQAKEKINTEAGYLIQEAPVKDQVILSAKSEIIDKKNQPGFSAKLDTLYP